MLDKHLAMPEIILRASVSRYCNFSCKYCPKGDWLSGGMENYSPDCHFEKVLSPKEYASVLRQIRNVLDVRKISFTGGEPTLNAALPDIIKAARGMFERVEITTNGSLISEQLITAFESLDLVKVSLDSLDPRQFMNIAGINDVQVFDRVISTIRRLTENSTALAINMVVMKRNLPELRNLIEFAEKAGCQVHLLDYVHYPSKHQDWEDEFVPLEFLAEVLAEEYGKIKKLTRYGCTFYSLDTSGISIQFKDSMTATIRAKSCDACSEYCQEGPYGLKLSAEGWVTACPSIDLNKGVALSPESSDEDNANNLAILRPMFSDTFIDASSFDKFLRTWNLHPTLSRDRIRALFQSAGYKKPDMAECEFTQNPSSHDWRDLS